jgi:clan AA aspartic protease (TIGR02281 family)
MHKNIIKVLFVAVSLMGGHSAWGGVINKCKNQEGAVVYQNTPCQENHDTVSSWTPKAEKNPVLGSADMAADKGKEPIELNLKQNPYGHFSTEGSINNKPINFIVDTGASFVALPEAVAHDALIYCDNKVKMDTANGMTDACTSKISSLTFGPFQIKEVLAVIQPNLRQPLLGMNVLQLFKIEQKSGEMKISIVGDSKSKENPKGNAASNK